MRRDTLADVARTRAELIDENRDLRTRIAELERRTGNSSVDVLPSSLRIDAADSVPDGRTSTLRFAAFEEIGVVHGTTDRRRAENSLRERDLELIHVARLTTMGEMVAEVAHEISHPQYAISNFSEACRHLLVENNYFPEDPLFQWIARIDKIAQSAGQILNRLKQFVAEAPGDTSTFDVRELVSDAIELVNFDAKSSNVSVTCDLLGPDLFIRANRVQIQQVLVNLLRNAYEALRECERDKRVEIVHTTMVGGEIEVAVKDNGPGMTEETRDHVFSLFFSTKPQGLGVGLAVSRTIIEEHGGRLWFTINPEGGTTFKFTLPLAEGNGDP